MAQPQEWTTTRLVAEANERGFALSPRQITEWTTKGLIDKPRRRGTGRGSAPGVWSENQAEVLWAVLDKHRAINRPGRLADIPVGMWLAGGDEYASILQIRRAVRTWAGVNTATSRRRVRHTADLVVGDFAGTGKRLPKALRDRLTDLLMANVDGAFAPNRSELEATLRALIGVSNPKLAIPKVDDFLKILEARITGVWPFAMGSDQVVFTDDAIRQAGAVYRQTRPGYMAQSGTSGDAMNQELFDRSCLILVTLLGHPLVAANRANETS